MGDRNAEREAITAAMQRLLDGTPQRSTGALTVLQLAAEAGIKRWVLTHKHPDLKEEFERRRATADGVPAAYQTMAADVTDLQHTNARLRTENNELRERIDAYGQTIYQLCEQLRHLEQQHQPPHNNVRMLTRPGSPPMRRL
jgi:predicted nuclease with TOPRIM domain